MKSLASLFLRLSLGAVFLAYGLQYVFGMFNGPGIHGFSNMLSNLGFYNPDFWAYVIAYSNMIGGLCLILGLLTRVASVVLFVITVFGGIKLHLANGFFIANSGFEYNLIIACALLALFVLGSGRFGISETL